MRLIISSLIILYGITLSAQSYTSYYIGNNTDSEVNPMFGIVLMGGATENDNASRWFLQRANGGDVLVLRASGSDGYNDYFYSELGETVNSVETIVINEAQGAVDPYVLDKIAKAEAIWFAGGDQWNYVSFFRDTTVETLLNSHINEKQGVIGGTSAGMAILGQHYFSAQNGTVTTAQAIANPYDSRVALGYADFISSPLLENTITDTHFDNPDRRGRLMAFLARMGTDQEIRPRAIASEEYVAICIDATGEARVFGDFPEFQDFAYFAQANCTEDFLPEQCSDGNTLIWDRDGAAVKVYKVPGTTLGDHFFNILDWTTGSGGEWLNWSVSDGSLQTAETENPDCDALSIEDFAFAKGFSIYPNPAQKHISVTSTQKISYAIYNILGEKVQGGIAEQKELIDIDKLSSGIYFFKVEGEQLVEKFIKL